MLLQEYIKNLEQKLLEPSARKSKIELDQLLSDDFIEITPSGNTFNKNKIIESLQNEQFVFYSLKNFKITHISRDVILANYLSVRTKNSTTGKTTYAMRSSIWKCVEEKWKMIFHQGTPCKVEDFEENIETPAAV